MMLIEHHNVSGLIDNDQMAIDLANTHREMLHTSPSQSEFRVYAILVVEKTDGNLILVQGANQEQGYIGGAICAERAALCALR